MSMTLTANIVTRTYPQNVDLIVGQGSCENIRNIIRRRERSTASKTSCNNRSGVPEKWEKILALKILVQIKILSF